MEDIPTDNIPQTAEQSQSKAVSRFGAFYELTKPGITKMVVLSAAAGYYLGLPHVIDHFSRTVNIVNFFLTIIGTALVSAGSCVLNNYAERDYDVLMKRTMQRPIPSGVVSPQQALVFGIATAVLGVTALFFINLTTALLAVATLLLYVFIYTPLKRKTTLSLLIGGIPGAIPTIDRKSVV